MTDCARCGRCCVDITIQKSPADFEAWFDGFDFGGDNRESSLYDAWFISTHWAYEGPDKRNGHRYQCDMFDQRTKECMAHEARPNVCSGYPWYHGSRKYDQGELKPYEDGKYLHPQCSFNGDVRKMLPIVEIK